MRHNVQAPITVCGKRETRLNIINREVREVVQNFRDRHTAAKVIEHMDTVMRVPRMQGLPLRTRESMVMRSK